MSSSGLQVEILELAKNLVITSKATVMTASATEVLSCLAQKRLKMFQFFSAGCKGLATLSSEFTP
jgi:hypothetical protein